MENNIRIIMRCNMGHDKQARLAALKFLLNIDPRAAYTYADARKAMTDIVNSENVSPEYYQNILNSACGLAFFKGYKLPIGGVIFKRDSWHDFVDVIADELTFGENYTTRNIHSIVNRLLGVDIDDIVTVLCQQKLIRSVVRYVNGGYTTVYTKNW